MDKLIIEAMPILMTAFVAAIGWQWRESQKQKMKVAVLEKALEDLLKTIESMQKRQDGHSKKQDDILEKMNSMEHELLRRLGDMGSNISSLASDVKNLNNLLAITDVGIKIQK